MISEDALQMGKIIYKNFHDKNYEKTKMQLVELENCIMANCNDNSSLEFDKSFYEYLISVIEEISKSTISTNRVELEIAKSTLICLRNSFYKNSANQIMVGKNEVFMKTVTDFLKILIDMDSRYLDSGDNNSKTSFNKTLSTCITFYVNLISGNSLLKNCIWTKLQLYLTAIVRLSSPEVNHVGAALVHQFLVEDFSKQIIFRGSIATQLVQPLLNAYIHPGPYACFALYCLEIFIESDVVITSAWKSLKPVESLLLLDILSSNVENGKVPVPVVSFCKEILKDEADRILRTFEDLSSTEDPQVIIRIASFICSSAASDHYRSILQADRSLLISSIFLLKEITDIGINFENNFTRLSDSSLTEEVKSHPVFGLKSDLIRLIASLVYRNKENQDVARDENGVLLILENSQYDARNPLIREACIFAIRNLLEGNEENQKVIADLQLKGPARNETLSGLGLEVSVVNGKVSIQQID